jgi:hypothetical protein
MPVYDGDLNLSNDRGTRLVDGDFDVTVDDSAFFRNIFTSTQGSWANHPGFGFSFSAYLGRMLNDELIQTIKDEAVNYFNSFGMQSKINIFKLTDDEISIFLDIEYNLTESIEIQVDMDFVENTIEFPTMPTREQTKVDIINQKKYPTKYQQRRDTTGN